MKPLRLLVAEDSESDYLLIVAELEAGGFQVTSRCVDTSDAMRQALEAERWDIILSDYSMPQFTALDALALVQRSRQPDVPFVVVSGSIGEESAVATLKAGASNYLMKSNLDKLVHVVERELRDARVRRERAETFVALEQAVRVRDEFLAIASHELKTPLTAVQLQLESLRDVVKGSAGSCTDERLPSRLERAVKSTQRLGHLVQTLLDVSKISTGGMQLHLEQFDLVSSLRDVVERLREEARGVRCELVIEGDDTLIGTWDRARIEQVVTHLLSNAIKYGAGKPIELEVTHSPSGAKLRVIDHGLGISDEDLERIFGRFERAVPSRHYGGLGLGLFITRQIVATHGGTIKATRTVGGGATLIVELPLTTTEQVPVASPITVPARELPADAAPRATPARSGGSVELSALIESVQDYAVYMLDADGRVITWNAGAERIKQYSAREVIGKHFSLFYTDDDVQQGKPAKLLRAAAQNGRVEDEGWRVRKDGTRFWADVIIRPVRNESGQLIGYAKVTRDLTDRREAEQTLRQSEERLRLMISSVKEYAIVMLDADGRITSWNAGAERLHGYRADEIMGQHVARFYLPADVALGKPRADLDVARAVGRFEADGWRVRKDGTRFWANIVVTAVRDAAGQLVGFTKVTRDMTDRKRAEDQLGDRARQQEAVATLGVFALTTRDLQAMFERAVQLVTTTLATDLASLLELEPGGTALVLRAGVGWDAASIGSARLPLGSAPLAGLTLEVGAPVSVEDVREEQRFIIPQLLREHDVVSVMSVVIPSVTAEAPYGVLAVFTKQRRAFSANDAHFLQAIANVVATAITRHRGEEQLRRAEQMASNEREQMQLAKAAILERDDFIAVAAHELRTPLTALQLKLQSVEQLVERQAEERLAANIAGRLEAALRHTGRLSDLVERLLDVSRIVRGELEIRPEAVDLAALCRELIAEFGEQARAANVEIKLTASGDTQGTWDKHGIEQVLANLVANALKYGRDKPVEISIVGDGADVQVIVKDAGIGVSQGDAERIFDRFERAAPVRHYGGLGLGLYIARHIVEAHGGSIRVISEQGRGATFLIDLPKHPRNADAGASASAELRERS